jgi:queuine tRNA-ribosyltransferase
MSQLKRTLGDYEVHRAWEGFASIRQISSGEIMHSRTSPMEEAIKLYVEQSDLAQRLRLAPGEAPNNATPLTIWDVGLGAAANAMAAILCFEKESKETSVRPLDIVSFENDLDSLRLALECEQDFPYLAHEGPKQLLADGNWRLRQMSGLNWLLIPGDFRQTMSSAPTPPDLIFYDMFSTKTSTELWTLSAFKKLFDTCAGSATELFTYSCSTANRVALLAAGFHVARGRNAGEKAETTIALTPAAARSISSRRYDLLTNSWLQKWDRSRAKFPKEIPADQQPSFEKLIRAHAQFQQPV